MDFTSLHLHEIVGLLVLLGLVISIIKLHRNPNNDFNILDIIMENGKVSRIAFVFIGSWLALTFVFVGLYFQSKMSDAMYMAYGTVCFAPIIAKMFSAPLVAPAIKE